VDSFIE